MLKKKLKNIFFGFTGTAIHCPYCKSMNVKFGKSMNKGNVEKYKVSCRDCGAKGHVKETWSKGSD